MQWKVLLCCLLLSTLTFVEGKGKGKGKGHGFEKDDAEKSVSAPSAASEKSVSAPSASSEKSVSTPSAESVSTPSASSVSTPSAESVSTPSASSASSSSAKALGFEVESGPKQQKQQHGHWIKFQDKNTAEGALKGWQKHGSGRGKGHKKQYSEKNLNDVDAETKQVQIEEPVVEKTEEPAKSAAAQLAALRGAQQQTHGLTGPKRDVDPTAVAEKLARQVKEYNSQAENLVELKAKQLALKKEIAALEKAKAAGNYNAQTTVTDRFEHLHRRRH